jgi:hypothetical protein
MRPQVPQGRVQVGGEVHVLHSDPFFTIEFYAFHVASLVIVLSWLYRHVRRELRRKDD